MTNWLSDLTNMNEIELRFGDSFNKNLFILGFKNRLIAKTRVDEATECWVFKGALDWTGYGLLGVKLNDKYRLIAVHRLSAYIFHGLDLTQNYIKSLHKCNRRNCWNPDHLYLGTQMDNVRDALNSGRHRNIQNGLAKRFS